ncbi:phospholipase, partial [Enterococcus hirae]
MIRPVLCASVLVALRFVSACGQASVSTEGAVAEAAGKEAPKPAPDFALEDADGNEGTLSGLKG